MDLGAYAKIDAITSIAEENGIEIPRLRGYRLMSEEQIISEEQIEEAIKEQEATVYEDAITSIPRFSPNSCWHEYSDKTDWLKKKYLLYKTIEEVDDKGEMYSFRKVIGIKWSLIHGRNRKAIKYALKKARIAVWKNLQTFNKYVGREDVLYIHARIGGENWSHYGGYNLEKEPWFLEKVDDFFDDTYCDIYAKIKPNYKGGEG